MSIKSAGICILDTDKKLFLYLYENKVATVEQINRDVYRYERLNTLYARLRKISKIGLIEVYRSPYLKTKNICSLTRKGFKEFLNPEVEGRAELKSSKELHDVELVDIRFHFTQFEEYRKYYTENVLQSKSTLLNQDSLMSFEMVRPDAVAELTIKSMGYLVAVEYESNLKYHSRYRDGLFKKYYGEKSVAAILYICRTQEMLDRIVTYERKYLEESSSDQSSKFYYATLESLRGKSVSFTNLRNKAVVLNRKPEQSNLDPKSIHHWNAQK